MKKIKQSQIKIFVLTLALVLSFSGVALADCGQQFQGSGTPEDPFQISTAEDLKALSDASNLALTARELRECTEVSYRLTADIDMIGYDWWRPIGDSSVRIFYGDFDGAGHTIYNLGNTTVNGSAKGLFGWMAGSVHDLNLSNVNFQSIIAGTDSGMGGVVGTLYTNGVIENVNVSGVITAGGTGTTIGRNAGGIVGVVVGPDARISSSSFNGDIVGVTSSANFLGGIIGYVSQQALRLTVSDCFSSGTITRPGTGGGLYLGKIAGGWDTSAILNNPPTFNFCYSSMTIDAKAAWDRPWSGYDGIDFDPAELTTLGIYYNDGKISAKNAHRLAVATLWLEVGAGMPSFSGLNGFHVMDSVMDGNLYRVTLGYMVAGGYGFTGVNAGLLGISGATGVTIKGRRFVAYNAVGNAFDLESTVEKEGGGGIITDPVNYDLNHDGTVDQLDLAIALKYFMAANGDTNWDAAKIADFNKDNVVDIEDFIQLLNHMDW